MPELPPYHPMTVLRDWSKIAPGACYRIADAHTHLICFGATGSGKTSGPARHFALAYLDKRQSFGGVVLCSKNDERPMWEEWAEEAGRWDREKQTGDLIIIDKSAKWRFNFLDHEASRAGAGAGLTINIVALLDEIAAAVAGGEAQGKDSGENKFFEDALHHMNTNLVDLCQLAGLPVSLPLMQAALTTAPQSLREADSSEWKHGAGQCAALLREADEATIEADEDARGDYEQCRSYWTQEFPNLSEKTRSIVSLSFSMLARPFITRPLRRLFSTDTNVTPEDTFDGKIIIVDLPVQEYRLAGRVANLAWKYCFQVAVLRRMQPQGDYLRPVFLWADEAANFLTDYDALWASVSRSAGGCFCLMVQNRESMLRVLKSAAAVDSLLGNLQCHVFCQNSSVETNNYAAKLLGERWQKIISTTGGRSNPDAPDAYGTMSDSATISEQKRYWVEPSAFTTLKRGGPQHDYQVEAILYNGGHRFQTGRVINGAPQTQPFALFTFNQQRR